MLLFLATERQDGRSTELPTSGIGSLWHVLTRVRPGLRCRTLLESRLLGDPPRLAPGQRWHLSRRRGEGETECACFPLVNESCFWEICDLASVMWCNYRENRASGAQLHPGKNYLFVSVRLPAKSCEGVSCELCMRTWHLAGLLALRHDAQRTTWGGVRLRTRCSRFPPEGGMT